MTSQYYSLVLFFGECYLKAFTLIFAKTTSRFYAHVCK